MLKMLRKIMPKKKSRNNEVDTNRQIQCCWWVFDKENKQRSPEPFHYCYSSYGSRLDYGTVVKSGKGSGLQNRDTQVQILPVPPYL